MFITISADGELMRLGARADGEAVQEAVGGWFDIIAIRRDRRDLSAFVNDDGFSLDLPRNPIGACVAVTLGAPGYIYAGPIAITGWDAHAAGPEITDLTAEQAELIETIHGYVRRALAGERVDIADWHGWSDEMRGYVEHVRSEPAPGLTIIDLDEVLPR